ncbi:MAG: hypothetical protein KJ626_07565 [Verrucomicrobia bacterium]|nr:hypothetical protein [Verrucomicrobiota bacterium]
MLLIFAIAEISLADDTVLRSSGVVRIDEIRSLSDLDLSERLPGVAANNLKTNVSRNWGRCTAVEGRIVAEDALNGPLTAQYTLLVNSAERGKVAIEGQITRSPGLAAHEEWNPRLFIPEDVHKELGVFILNAIRIEVSRHEESLSRTVKWIGSEGQWPERTPMLTNRLMSILASDWAAVKESESGELIDETKPGYVKVSPDKAADSVLLHDMDLTPSSEGGQP